MTRARRQKPAPVAPAPAPLGTPQDGPGWGVYIQRRYEPRDWPRALEIVPQELRASAEEYLRGMAARMRVIRRLKGSPDGPPSSS